MATIQKRRRNDGKNSYRVQVRMIGHPTVSKTFSRLQDAKDWAQGVESDMKRGKYSTAVEAQRHTVRDMIERYLNTLDMRSKKTQTNRTSQLKWWADRLGDYHLAHLAPKRIAACRDELLKTVSKATAVRYLASLSHCCSTAVSEYEWLEDNPCKKVKRPTEPKGRCRILTKDERKRLVAVCREIDPDLLLAVVLSISTGGRQGEIMGLRWSQVDFDRNRILLEDTKNDERRALPLHAMAHELMAARTRGEPHELVFPGRGGRPRNLRRPWEEALEAAQIDDFRWHDLRHCAASEMAMSGATLAEIAELLGHKTLAMVRRYSHLTDSHVSERVRRMNEKLFD